jgi:aubergine-like protein
MEEGVLQELIFGQCFNYVNWTGSIKVPSVLQYAKKSAKFSSEVLERSKVPVELFGKPYFV